MQYKGELCNIKVQLSMQYKWPLFMPDKGASGPWSARVAKKYNSVPGRRSQLGLARKWGAFASRRLRSQSGLASRHVN